MATKNETPENVAELATQAAKLPSTALIGIFGAVDDPRALVRLPDGDIARVTTGDAVAGGTVTAIGPDRLILSRMGTELVLSLPAA